MNQLLFERSNNINISPIQGKSLCDLEAILNLLSAPNVKQLAKDFNLKPKGTQKADFSAAILKHSRQKSFFTVGMSLAKKVETK